MSDDKLNWTFSGDPPPGEPFTCTDCSPHGTSTITGVYTKEGILYITGQEWKPNKQFAEWRQYGKPLFPSMSRIEAAIKRMYDKEKPEKYWRALTENDIVLAKYLAKHPEKGQPGGHIRCKSLNPLVIDEEAEESR